MSGGGRSNPTGLKQAHDVLSGERPSENASPSVWLAYYRRSASVYAQVAEIDRAHHHEALYWAAREDRKAREIEEQLRTPTTDRRAGRAGGGGGRHDG